MITRLSLLIFFIVFPIQGISASIWFGDIQSPLKIDIPEATRLLNHAHLQLENGSTQSQPEGGANSIDPEPRIIFLSISDKISPATVVIGKGLGIAKAIQNALDRARKLNLARKSYWIKLDVVQQVNELRITKNTRMDLYDPSMYGLALDKSKEFSLLPEELPIKNIFTKKNKLDFSRVNKYLEDDITSPDDALTTIYRFSTSSFFHNGYKVYPLFRGHRIINSINPNDALTSAINAGDYLLKSINADGSFGYSYDAGKNIYNKKYNMLRHAGTVYSLLQLYEHTRKKSALSKIEKTISYMHKHIAPCNNNLSGTATDCLIYKNKIKLGANALAIIALTKHIELTGDISNKPVANNLGQWIIDTMAADGSFKVHKQNYESGEISSFISQYYPGEASLALLSLYKLDKNKKWLNAAITAIDYIINQQNKLDEPPHDHWLLISLTELYNIKPDKKYLGHSVKIANSIMSSQNMKPSIHDWKGSYYTPPRSTPTAIRTEGLIAAYEMATKVNGEDYKNKLLTSIESGLRFQLQTQYNEGNVIYLPRPEKAIYGFKKGLTDNEIRIDYVQHNISGLINYYCISKGNSW
jgi:hypothetical protein